MFSRPGLTRAKALVEVLFHEIVALGIRSHEWEVDVGVDGDEGEPLTVHLRPLLEPPHAEGHEHLPARI